MQQHQYPGKPNGMGPIHGDTGVCEHLRPVVDYVREAGAVVTFAGQAWSRNSRVWVYVDAILDCEGLKAKLNLPASVQIHDHRGTHDGSERGLVCNEHHDAVMGLHPGAVDPHGVKRIA